MKIVILDGYCLNNGDLSWDGFRELGEVVVYDRTDYKDIIPRLKDADIAITNKTPIDRNIIENTNIKYIGVLATGYNIIDINCCREHNITVCNIPEYSTNAVAQLTFALILEFTNRVVDHSASVKNGDWCNCKDFCYSVSPLTELNGKTIGLIGYGSIGRAVAKIAVAFGMKVLYYKPSGKVDCNCDNIIYSSLDNLLSNSDIVSLHCPMNDKTNKIINSNTISKMKKNVIIINTARGQLVDESDLAKALNNGRVKGYGCDVLSTEPPKVSNAIISAKNTIITPHIAWQAYETRNRLMNIAVDNLKCFLKGKAQNNVMGVGL